MRAFSGVWVTMVTPYYENGRIDYGAVDAMVEHFVGSGIDGIFAVCQSSEMFWLSDAEKSELCRRIVRAANGRIRVIASGFTSYNPEDQARDVLRARDAGAEASVLITSLIAPKSQGDDQWMAHLDELLGGLPPDLAMGLYECPFPYKRLLSPDMVKALAQSGRFVFLKETSCALAQIGAKVEAAQGSPLSILNANAQLLVPSFRVGAAGFSGVMANMQAALYAYLWNRRAEDGRGGLYDRLAQYLSATASFEASGYPASAKYVLNRCGVSMGAYTRNPGGDAPLSESVRYMLDRFADMNREWEARCRAEWGPARR